MLNYTRGCPVPIYTRSTLGSGSIKVKGFQERPTQQREACKENAQNDPLSLPSLFPACTCSMSPLFCTQTHRETQTQTHVRTHADSHTQIHMQTHRHRHTNLVHELFCFKGLNSFRKKKKKVIPYNNGRDLAYLLLSHIYLAFTQLLDLMLG